MQLPPSPFSATRSLSATGLEPGASGWLPVSDSYVVMSGCRDEEVAHEFDREEDDGKLIRHGALTHFLTGELSRTEPGATYRDVFDRARRAVNTKYPQQHPQIEGTLDREVLGVRNIPSVRFVPVTAVDGETVTLAAGAAQGMTRGSVYSIHGVGGQDCRRTGHRHGRGRVS